MDETEKYLSRVQNSAEGLATQLRQSSNVPLDTFIDLGDVKTLTEALALDPSSVCEADLVRMHIFRDAFHDLLHSIADSDANNEFSVEQLLNSISRLYVDVERVLKGSGDRLQGAADKFSKISDGQREVVPKSLSEEVAEEANAVITTVQFNQRIINISILNFNVGELNLLKEFKMNVKRLSASVFAIRLNFDAGIVFEGTIRFLNEGVDRILSDIRNFASIVKEKYNNVSEFIHALDPIIEKGTRFVKLIGKIIKDLFDGGDPLQKEVIFTKQTATTSDAITCASITQNGDIIFGGRGGCSIVHTRRTAQFLKLPYSTKSDVFNITSLPQEQGFVLGTAEGVCWVQSVERNRRAIRSSFSERISALETPNWGENATGIVSGSTNGYVRRWTLSGGLDAYRDATLSRPVHEKFGKTIKAFTRWRDKLVVAVDEKIIVVDEKLRSVFEVHVDKPISGLCAFPDDSVIVTGAGLLAEVNLARGAYHRLLTVTPTTNYVCVAHLNNRIAVVATEGGILRAIDMNSGAEVGEINLQNTIRGLAVQGKTVFAYGGAWKGVSQSIIKVLWEEAIIE